MSQSWFPASRWPVLWGWNSLRTHSKLMSFLFSIKRHSYWPIEVSVGMELDIFHHCQEYCIFYLIYKMKKTLKDEKKLARWLFWSINPEHVRELRKEDSREVLGIQYLSCTSSNLSYNSLTSVSTEIFLLFWGYHEVSMCLGLSYFVKLWGLNVFAYMGNFL